MILPLLIKPAHMSPAICSVRTLPSKAKVAQNKTCLSDLCSACFIADRAP